MGDPAVGRHMGKLKRRLLGIVGVAVGIVTLRAMYRRRAKASESDRAEPAD
jgi:hypothetical protein